MSSSIAYNNAAHFVFDVETLAVSDDATILEIGCVVAIPDNNGKLKLQGKLSHAIDLKSQLDEYHCTIDPVTLMWWINKGDMLKQIYSTKDVFPLDKSLNIITQLVNDVRAAHDAVYFWSRGPEFDYRIIKNALTRYNMQPFWKFWELRDIRTISNPLFLDEQHRTINNHRAVDDALNEANELITVVNKFATLKETTNK